MSMKWNFKNGTDVSVEEVKEIKPKEVKVKVKEKGSILSKLSKSINGKVISKPIIKSSQVSINIKETEPAEYKSRFFKNEWEETKKSLFLQ